MKIQFKAVVIRVVEFEEDELIDLYGTIDRDKILLMEQTNLEGDPMLVLEHEDANWDLSVKVLAR